MTVEIQEKTIGDIFPSQNSAESAKCNPESYIVPRYQREYAWGREEICKFLTDLWESFCSSSERKYYLGTLVVKKRSNNNEWNVIDGQQRLTTLTLLMRFLRKCSDWDIPLSFATRISTNRFLNGYCKGKSGESFEDIPQSFKTAIDLIENFRPSLKNGGEHPKSIGTGLLEEKNGELSFSNFIFQKVVMFQVIMPNDTDEMDYFEVMNNRGEQLEFHEMLKAELLTKLHNLCVSNNAPDVLRGKYDVLSRTFNLIWTACSKMDGHLIDHLHVCHRFKEDPKLQWTLLTSLKDDLDESGVPHERQSVIRDFSIFLMHVLKLYLKENRTSEQEELDIPLDERVIKNKYDEVDQKIHIDPVLFLQTLVIARLNFDKYVVKAKIENDVVVEWCLKEIVKCQNGKYEAKCTFEKGSEATEDEHTQKKLVYLQAALQVSNATQRYKEWVYEILSAPEEVRKDGNKLLMLLEAFAAKRIRDYKEEWENKDKELGKLGLQTPRLLLNIIDYLMWKASSVDKNANFEGVDFSTPKSFVFGYQNSIEHHHAQRDDTENNRWSAEQMNNIGNLYLTSNSENSSMGKHSTKEKVSIYLNAHNSNFPDDPKRHWMYVHTGENWSMDQMEKLGRYVMELINKFIS